MAYKSPLHPTFQAPDMAMAYHSQFYPAYQRVNMAYPIPLQPSDYFLNLAYRYQFQYQSPNTAYLGKMQESENRRHTLENWDAENNKDLEEYYADPQFRWDYMTHRMPRKAVDCELLMRHQMQELILCRNSRTAAWNCVYCQQATDKWQQIAAQYSLMGPSHAGSCSFANPGGRTLRILSLGCGPGTDLLAAIRACVRLGGVQRIECYGVDKHQWPTTLFTRELCVTRAACASRIDILPSFIQCDSVQFINNCIFAGIKFDLVISCYARARDKCLFLGHSVPRVLNEFGRIFVIDNNSHELTQGLHPMGFYPVCERIGGKLIFLVYNKVGRLRSRDQC